MIHVALIDDEEDSLRLLQGLLSRAFEDENMPADLETFRSGEAFLGLVREHSHLDACFIDIEMPGSDGIEICRQLRSICPQLRILFVSGREELVYDSFEVSPFRFLPKRRLASMLPPAVHALCEDIRRHPGRELTVSDAGGDIYSFPLQNIRFIEARNKDCRIVTTDGEAQVRRRLADLEELLPHPEFIKIHRSYIVHASFVFLIGKTSVSLTGGEELPLSRGRVSEVKAAFLKYATE